jgi:hypothetical protein
MIIHFLELQLKSMYVCVERGCRIMHSEKEKKIIQKHIFEISKTHFKNVFKSFYINFSCNNVKSISKLQTMDDTFLIKLKYFSQGT